MIKFPARPIGLSAVLLVSLSGCASLPHLLHWAKIRPIPVQASSQVAGESGYYASASAAISRRDYATALEQLQAARARKPDDVRVLNAFGVVYDKLGRFDLSARYYSEAKALDPSSQIVANNMAYSTALQDRAALPVLAQLQPSGPAPVLQLAAATPSVIRLDFASASTVLQTLPGLTGRPVEVANASGRKGAGELVRAQLARQGWSAPKSFAFEAAEAPTTTISYPPRSSMVAQALARTLPRGIQLVDCGGACEGIRLTLGADSLGWTRQNLIHATSRGD